MIRSAASFVAICASVLLYRSALKWISFAVEIVKTLSTPYWLNKEVSCRPKQTAINELRLVSAIALP